MSRNKKHEYLSIDHKPWYDVERPRIEKARGYIDYDGRINGKLGVSRAFGDYDYKIDKELKREEQQVIADPDITITKIEADCEFLVIATDGIWDCRSMQDMMDEVHDVCYKNKFEDRGNIPLEFLKEGVEKTFDKFLAVEKMGSHGIGTDNMTMILVELNPIK